MTETHDTLTLLAADALLVWAIRPDVIRTTMKRETLQDAAERVARDPVRNPPWRVEIARAVTADPSWRTSDWWRNHRSPTVRERQLVFLRAASRAAAQFLLEVSELESEPRPGPEDKS